jgi:pimeloyl-ACP methyl ester carboxylesterase
MRTITPDQFRESLIVLLGAAPESAPLLPVVLDVQGCPGYRREHIKYQVSPGDWAFAYLLVPNELRSAAPVIYCHHDHNYNFKLGKTEIVTPDGDRDFAIGPELVGRGYIVFAPDAVGFGERRSPKSTGSQFDLEYNFQLLAAKLLRGDTLLRKVISDVSRGIDYLETRSEVDSRQIGFLGQGYGALMALWATALEPRIRAAVAHGGIVTLREQIKRGEWMQPEFVVPRLANLADLPDVLSLVAPRPFLLSAAGPRSADAAEVYVRTRPVYQKQGAVNRFSLYRYRSGDDFEAMMRVRIYSWLDSWINLNSVLPA